MPNKIKKIAFKSVWKVEPFRESSIHFWRETLTSIHFDVYERSAEVVFQVIEDDRVIGLSTAKETHMPNFGENLFFNFRMLIHPDYRMPGLADKLTVETINFLESLFIEGKSKSVGIITLIENQEMNERRREAVYPSSGLTFIGTTKSGAQMRIKYFKGARI